MHATQLKLMCSLGKGAAAHNNYDQKMHRGSRGSNSTAAGAQSYAHISQTEFFLLLTARRLVKTVVCQSPLALLTFVFAIACLPPKERYNDPFTGADTTPFAVVSACA